MFLSLWVTVTARRRVHDTIILLLPVKYEDMEVLVLMYRGV